MLKDYIISIFNGRQKEVFQFVAPFAMDRKVIREMGGYPILADDNTVWFVAFKEGEVCGFAALQIEKIHAVFSYAYILPEHRDKGLYQLLFDDRIKWVQRNKIALIKADCTKESLSMFLKKGFKVVKEFSKWTKVQKEL